VNAGGRGTPVPVPPADTASAFRPAIADRHLLQLAHLWGGACSTSGAVYTAPYLDATLYVGKPASPEPASLYNRLPRGRVPGLGWMVIEDRVWLTNPADPLSFSAALFAAWVDTIPAHARVCLDLELPMVATSPFGTDPEWTKALDISPIPPALAAARAARPDLRWGIYGTLPGPVSYPWALNMTAILADYAQRNAEHREHVIASVGVPWPRLLDYVILDAYCAFFPTDPAHWWPTAIAGNLTWARAIGLPVYAIVWNRRNRTDTLPEPFPLLAPEDYRLGIRALLAGADGIIQWAGPAAPYLFGETYASSSWWRSIAEEEYRARYALDLPDLAVL
jgi:hypothetical protein